jgi:hypothetical protein
MTEREKALEAALTAMVEEQCDYMRINHLGDPEKQHTIKQARAALAMPAHDWRATSTKTESGYNG